MKCGLKQAKKDLRSGRNGVVERANKSIIEMVRTMIADSKNAIRFLGWGGVYGSAH